MNLKPFVCVKQTLILMQFKHFLTKTNSFWKEENSSNCYKLVNTGGTFGFNLGKG